MKAPGYNASFFSRPQGTVKRRVASKLSSIPPYVHPLNSQSTTPGVHPLVGTQHSSVAPVAGTPLGSSVAPVTPPDPAANDPQMPDPKDSTYVAGIAGDMNARTTLAARLTAAFTNNTAGATNSGNKAGLLHSSTLANQLADIGSGYKNDLTDLYSQYGNPNDPNDHGTHGAQLLGEAQQRHLGDPAPFVVDDATSRAAGGVGLASGWRILYDANNKPIRFLKPGEKYNGQ